MAEEVPPPPPAEEDEEEVENLREQICELKRENSRLQQQQAGREDPVRQRIFNSLLRRGLEPRLAAEPG